MMIMEIEITRKQILLSAKDYCRKYGIDFNNMLENNGGVDEFVKKVVAIDRDATLVINKNSAGQKYICIPLWRLDCEPNYRLISWAYGKGYASYSSAEIVCRGGYSIEKRSKERYDVDGDIIDDVKYSI